MNRYKDILTTKKDHLEEEKNISVDERVDNLIKLKTIRKKHENILNIQKKYLEDKKTISVDERIKNLKKLKSTIKKYENDILNRSVFRKSERYSGFFTIWKDNIEKLI